jgi:O-antigen/teichoic acid export membrane protein
MLKKLFSHTAIYGMAPYIPKLFSFFALPLITKDLTSNDYGIIGVITAYIGAVGIFNTLGLRLILVNSFYHYQAQYKWLWRQLYGFLILWIAIFAILTAILLLLVIPSEARENTSLIIALNIVPLVCFGPVGMIGSTYYQLKQQPMQVAGRTAFFGLLTVGLNIYTISVLKLGYMGWLWTECVVVLLTNASYWIVVNKKLKLTPIFNFKRRLIKRSLLVSLPTIPHYYATYLLNTSDRMVMSIVKVPTSSIGKYNLASNFGNYFSTLGIAFGLAAGPMLNDFYKKGKDTVARNLLFILQSSFFLITFITCLWLKELFIILIRNEELRQTYPLAIILIMSYNYRPMYLASNAKNFYKEKTSELWKITFIAGLLNVILNLIFVPIWGVMVAALTTFVSYMYMAYSGFFLNDFKKINTVNYYPMAWLSMTILLTVVVYQLANVSITSKIIITVMVLVGVIITYRKIDVQKVLNS